MKWRLLTSTKDATRQKQPQRQVQRQRQRLLGADIPFFVKEQLDEMTGEDQKNYRSIVSKTWKDIKEDPARLTVYNDRARKVKNEAQKPTKLGDDSLVSRMEQHEKRMAERATVKKKIQRQSQKAPKTPEFIDTDSDDSDNEPKPAVKHPLKAPKTSGHDDKDPQKTSL